MRDLVSDGINVEIILTRMLMDIELNEVLQKIVYVDIQNITVPYNL